MADYKKVKQPLKVGNSTNSSMPVNSKPPKATGKK